jgi:hypothetical protein
MRQVATMDEPEQAFRDFRSALERLLRAHGQRWTERSRIRLDMRPGMFMLSEVDGAEGEQPRLIISADDRDPATFGRRVELRDVAGVKR